MKSGPEFSKHQPFSRPNLNSMTTQQLARSKLALVNLNFNGQLSFFIKKGDEKMWNGLDLKDLAKENHCQTDWTKVKACDIKRKCGETVMKKREKKVSIFFPVLPLCVRLVCLREKSHEEIMKIPRVLLHEQRYETTVGCVMPEHCEEKPVLRLFT
jgi:hypothetical protein